MTGCSKDAEIEAFITENDAVLKDVAAKIDANPTAAGVDEAQKAFDAKKDSLKTKIDAIKGAVGMQVSDATKKKYEDHIAATQKTIMDMSTKNAMKLATAPGAIQKFQKLMTDYGSLFK
jgi:hypothetical protein